MAFVAKALIKHFYFSKSGDAVGSLLRRFGLSRVLSGEQMWVIRRRVDPLDSGCQNIGHLETSEDRAMQLMSVSAAARHLGYKSRSQLYKLMNDGWLDAHVHIQMPSGQRLLDVDGLQKTLQGLCQWRVDSVFLRR